MNRIKKLSVLVLLGASILMTSCATMGGGKSSYFSDANAKKQLKSEYRIHSKISELATQIRFSKDGTTLLIPPYQEAEKVFGYNEDDISILNGNTGGVLWLRGNKIINSKKMNINLLDAASMYNWKGCVLYVLYLADFINTYQSIAPEMINMETAPDWFKEVLQERKSNPTFAKNKEQFEIDSLDAKVEAKNKEITVSWTPIKFLQGVVIEFGKYSDRWDNQTKKIIKDKKQTSITFKNLENYRLYSIRVKFADSIGETVKTEWKEATPKSGNDALDYMKGVPDFTEENGFKFLKPEYNIEIYRRDYGHSNKIAFSKDGKAIQFIRTWSKAESVFNFTEEEMNSRDAIDYGRIAHFFDYKKHDIGEYLSVNNRGGNVYLILCLADFCNVYQEKAPSVIDLTNAPKWFTDLMAKRKAEGKTLIKEEFR